MVKSAYLSKDRGSKEHIFIKSNGQKSIFF